MLRMVSGLLMAGILVLLAACATTTVKTASHPYRIPLDSSNYKIEFMSKGFKEEVSDKKINYYYFTNSRNGLNVSINFDLTSDCSSSQTCRDFLVDIMRPNYTRFSRISEWKLSQLDNIFISEYLEKPGEGKDIARFNMNAHFYIDKIWIDVHLSKTDFTEKDRKLFLDFIKSVKIVPVS